MERLIRGLCIASIMALLASCGGGGGGAPSVPEGPGDPPQVGILASEAPDAEPNPVFDPADAFLLELLELCRQETFEAELDLVSACSWSGLHATALQTGLTLYDQQIAADARLIGRDMPTTYIGSSDPVDLSGAVLNVIPCYSDPDGDRQLNAFALYTSVFMLVPLMDAFAECAAWWDILRESAGGDPDAVDVDQLLGGFAQIMNMNSIGEYGTVVAPAEIQSRVNGSAFAGEAYFGAVCFVLFHEIAHANLSHGLVKCITRAGVEALLLLAGLQPTPAERQALENELAALSRGLETQSDIYSATMLADLGFTTNGPAIFVLGMASYRASNCNPGLSEAQRRECVWGGGDDASHPGLDVRANIITRIMDDGEDLTGLLELVEALDLGG